jgi:hypothetical protein
MGIADLTVSLSQRRWSCVLDPALALATPFGAALVRRLGALMDVYMVRGFFRALDSSEYYRRNPRALLLDQDEDTVRRQLQAWEQIRARSDLTGLKFYWIGDNQSESHLPDNAEPDLVQRYELLCKSLERRPRPKVRLVRPLFDEQLSSAVEVAALACALQPVVVLAHWSAAEGGAPPRLCRDLAHLGLECQAVATDTDAALAAIERNFLCHLLVHAGATPLFCAGLRVAVIHILAPNALIARTGFDEMRAGGEDALSTALGDARSDDAALGDAGSDDAEACAGADCWLDARVFWYRLSEGAAAPATRLVES